MGLLTSRAWIRFFFSTLLLGGVSTIIIGLFLRWNTYEINFLNFPIKEFATVSLWLLGVGFIFSVVSQMGFFAYLTLHRFGLHMFRSVWLWNGFQVVVVVFVLCDFVYLRSLVFLNDSATLLSNVLLALFLLISAIVIAIVKSKETNRQAFIPALFFMIVATIVEWVPALRVNDRDWMYIMLVPLVVCNAYQLLMLHRIINKEKVMYKG